MHAMLKLDAPLSETLQEAIEISTAAGLLYVSDAEPGIRRIGNDPQDFKYLKPDGAELTDAKQLQRIASLAIPPAYTDVWICPHPRGHVQATGRDARRRKQYRYHEDWRTVRDGAKFERMVEFGEALPRLRRRLTRDLARKGLPRDKVLAVIVTLLDVTRIRIGNAEYARSNRSFGLTTLRDRHVKFVRDGRALFKFRGKGGAEHEVAVDDRRLARIVRSCQELPGQQLFQYVDDTGARHPIDSDQVNQYLRETMGTEFTAKDFRTWSATLQAIDVMARTPLPESGSERACKALVTAAVKQVATELRNTPAVCRRSYINPVVFTAWRCGDLQKFISARPNGRSDAEKLALKFLRVQAAAALRRAKPARTSIRRSRRKAK